MIEIKGCLNQTESERDLYKQQSEWMKKELESKISELIVLKEDNVAEIDSAKATSLNRRVRELFKEPGELKY